MGFASSELGQQALKAQNYPSSSFLLPGHRSTPPAVDPAQQLAWRPLRQRLSATSLIRSASGTWTAQDLTVLLSLSRPLRGGGARRPWRRHRGRRSHPPRWATSPVLASQSFTSDGNKLIYFDNGATSQKPYSVMKTLDEYYRSYNSKVHRGIHALSAKATDAYESARIKVAKFVNVADSREIVFTRNATEAINLVAYSWGLSNLNQGDEIILTVAEHHSAIVPWQFVSQKTGATLKYVGLTKEEVPDIDQLKRLLSNKTNIVVVHHISNVLGSTLPIEEIVIWSNKFGAKVLVDACQSVPHMPVDVPKLGADFLVSSSHKMCGPTGIGFLHSKFEILSSMAPFLGGGEMIADVFQDKSTYAEPPSRFEAGAPEIGEAIGLGAAIDYLSHIGLEQIHEYEKELMAYLYESLISVPNVWIYDIAEILDLQHGVAIRSGHHCAQILHRTLGVNEVLVQVFAFTIQKRKWMSSSTRLKTLSISSLLNASQYGQIIH